MSEDEDKQINEEIAKILNNAGIDPATVSAEALESTEPPSTFEMKQETSPAVPVVVNDAEVIPTEENKNKDLKGDYKYTRENLYQIIEKGMGALDDLVHLANQNNHPRAFEVAGQMIKTLGDVHDQLINLHKKMKDLEQEGDGKGPKNVTNNLFVGSTTDLDKLIADREIKIKK